MANTVVLKRSSVAGKAPATTDLALGELGVNTTDGRLFLKKSASGTESIVEVTARPLDLGFFFQGTMGDGETLCRWRPPACRFPAGAAGSYADAGVAATGATTLTLNKNGTPFGTCAWGAGGTVATLAIAATTAFDGATDILTVTGPATADATLADVAIDLAGARA